MQPRMAVHATAPSPISSSPQSLVWGTIVVTHHRLKHSLRERSSWSPAAGGKNRPALLQRLQLIVGCCQFPRRKQGCSSLKSSKAPQRQKNLTLKNRQRDRGLAKEEKEGGYFPSSHLLHRPRCSQVGA